MKKSLLTLIGISTFGIMTSFSQPNLKNISKEKLKFYYEYVQNNCGLNEGDSILIIDGKKQKMYLVSQEADSFYVHKDYLVSTGKKGFGFEENSSKTPTGIHKIIEKIGQDVPKGGTFVNKKYTGKKAKIHKNYLKVKGDFMTSRLFVLDGVEEVNFSSYSRKIFLHGTNKEFFLGFQKSHGCIRMGNDEIIELDKLIHEGTYIYIFDK